MRGARWAWPAAIGVLLLALVVTSLGWWWSSRTGGLGDPGCYTLVDDDVLRVARTQGASTTSSTFSVTEDEDRVVLGYDEDVSAGVSTMEGYPVTYEVDLKRPLGERPVVDPQGDPVPECG